MPFSSFFHRETPEEKAEKELQKAADEHRKKAEEEKRLAEEEQARKVLVAERNDMLLPWKLEQKVAVVLNPVKIPFILIAGIVGSVVELKIGTTSARSWYRNLWSFGYGAECVVHQANYEALVSSSSDNSIVANMTRALDRATMPIMDWLNETAHNCSNCTDDNETNTTECHLLSSGPLFNRSWDDDYCGVVYDNETMTCKSPDEFEPAEDSPYNDDPDSWAGVVKIIPFVPHALVWMIFKLLFLLGHYVDRIHRLVAGADPPPEPMLKLLTEPTSKSPDGMVGKLHGAYGSVSKVIRFSLLPNTLILPLTSLRFVPQCRREYIIYTADTTVGFPIYCWLVFDLVAIVVLYAVGQTVFKGKALGQNWYLLAKVISVFTTLLALNLFLIDLYCCFDPYFWLGLQVLLQLSFTIDQTWGFSLDLARTVASFVVALDTLQFTIMVMSFLCPICLNKASRCMPGWLQKWTDRPADIKQNETADTDGTDHRLLLGGARSEAE